MFLACTPCSHSLSLSFALSVCVFSPLLLLRPFTLMILTLQCFCGHSIFASFVVCDAGRVRASVKEKTRYATQTVCIKFDNNRIVLLNLLLMIPCVSCRLLLIDRAMCTIFTLIRISKWFCFQHFHSLNHARLVTLLQQYSLIWIPLFCVFQNSFFSTYMLYSSKAN